MPSNLGWITVPIPLDVPKVWGTRGRLRVKGEINGFAFRTSLFPTGKGFHCLTVNKRLQVGANVAPGDTAQFRLQPDTEKRVVTVPAELRHVLNEDRPFRQWFDRLTFSIRKWICDWVTNVKSPQARVRRPTKVRCIYIQDTFHLNLSLRCVFGREYNRGPAERRQEWPRRWKAPRRQHRSREQQVTNRHGKRLLFVPIKFT